MKSCSININLRALGMWLSLGAVCACSTADFSNGLEDSLDGGPDLDSGDEEGDCVPGGVDAGPGDPLDGGPCPPGFSAGGCEELVAQTCGAICLESPGCAAAQLVAQYEPERCADALADSQTFPPCEGGNCDTLVDKVCGADDDDDLTPLPCAEAPGCAPALELRTRASDPDASQDELEQAANECLQALEDDVIFSACTE